MSLTDPFLMSKQTSRKKFRDTAGPPDVTAVGRPVATILAFMSEPGEQAG
jgi:hypothetical protein